MIIDLLTLVVIAAIFVCVPLGIAGMVIRRLNESDKRANNRNRELIDMQRTELQNRTLELEIRKAAYDLAQQQLDAGQEPTSLHHDV